MTYISPQDLIILVPLTLFLFAFLGLSSTANNSNHGLNKWVIDRFTNRRNRILLLAAFIIFIVLRQPSLLLHPRFWAEDGHIWFQYSAYHSVTETLMFLYPASGYFNLAANIGGALSSLAAAHFGIQYAPIATTALSLVLIVLPIAIVLLGRSRLFNSPWKVLTGCLIILFAPTATDEIWLNSVNSMTYLGLVAFLLVFEDTSSWPLWLKWIARAFLVLCGLSGVYSVSFLPLFVMSAYMYRQRETRIQCAILGVCLLLQSGIVAYSKIAGGGLPTRGSAVRLDSAMVNVLLGHVATPSLGVTATQHLIRLLGLQDAWMSATTNSLIHPLSTTMPLAGWFCFFLLAALLWRLRGTRFYSLENLVLAAFLILAALTSLASVNAVPQGRYAFLPGLAFLVLLLLRTERGGTLAKYLCMAVLAFGLSNGILTYRRTYFSGPPWSSEVEAWRVDHSYELRIWPSWIPAKVKYDPPGRTLY